MQNSEIMEYYQNVCLKVPADGSYTNVGVYYLFLGEIQSRFVL